MTVILLIEDELNIRETTADMLAFEGFHVEQAENGIEGIAKARDLLPDFIICDIMMPGLDGYQVLLELRSDPLTANIPFIFLTAKSDRLSMRHGMELGADDYITKPFDIKELLAAIDARLQKRDALSQEYEWKLDQLRNSLISTLPHELRTPLFGILGYIDLIKAGGQTYEIDDILRMVDVMERFGLRLKRLVENYLLYAQLELLHSDAEKRSQLQSLSYEQPHLIIEKVALEIASKYDRLEDLQTHLGKGHVYITEDSMIKIAEELIDNAFKFSEAGTRVQVTAVDDDAVYLFTVGDAGIGMSGDDINQIGAYNQFDRAIREQQGSGLGLTLAQKLTELHRGRLLIESEAEKGTLVTVELLNVR